MTEVQIKENESSASNTDDWFDPAEEAYTSELFAEDLEGLYAQQMDELKEEVALNEQYEVAQRAQYHEWEQFKEDVTQTDSVRATAAAATLLDQQKAFSIHDVMKSHTAEKSTLHEEEVSRPRYIYHVSRYAIWVSRPSDSYLFTPPVLSVSGDGVNIESVRVLDPAVWHSREQLEMKLRVAVHKYHTNLFIEGKGIMDNTRWGIRFDYGNVNPLHPEKAWRPHYRDGIEKVNFKIPSRYWSSETMVTLFLYDASNEDEEICTLCVSLE